MFRSVPRSHLRPFGPDRHWPVWLVSVWILAASGVLFAGPSAAQRFHVRDYGVAGGLPSAQVHDIVQDDYGRIWIAGAAGVASYDSREWRSYGLADGLAWADQAFLLLDAEDGLWAISRRPPHPPTRRIADRWIATAGPQGAAEGRRLRDAAVVHGDGGATELLYATDSGLLVGRDGAWRRLGRGDGLPSEDVLALALWQDRLIVGTKAGLATYGRGRISFLPTRLGGDRVPRRAVHALAVESTEDGLSALWLVGTGWIGRIGEAGGFELLADDLPFEPGERVEAEADLLGGLYVAGVEPVFADAIRDDAGLGLFYFARDLRQAMPATRGVQWLQRRHGISCGRVSSLYLDREHNLWIGGESGITKLITRRFVNWDRRHGLFGDEVVALLEQPEGKLLIGHRGGISALTPVRDSAGGEDRDPRRIARISTRSLQLESPDGRRVEPVRDLTRDAAGRIWLAAESAGVLRLDGDLDTLADLEIRRYGSDQGLRGDATAVLAVGDELWVGTDQGLRLRNLRSENGPFRAVPLPGRHPHVRRIFDATDDAAWSADGETAVDDRPPVGVVAATSAGLYHFDRVAWHHWHCERPTTPGEGTPLGACNSIFSALRREAGGWWVGTADGVYRTHGPGLGGSELLRAEPPALRAIRRPVFFLVVDAGDLWVGTDDGVYRVREDASEPQHFSVHDGLAGREMNRSAGLRNQSGDVRMGSDRGLTIYTRRFDRGRRPPPRMHLLGVEEGGRLHDLDDPLRLATRADDLLFRFQAVSLIDEDRVRYRSRLLGFDDAWSPPQSNREGELRYTNVPPGEYRFEVQAISAAGTWSDVARSAPVIVPRPFWLRPWFGALVLASLGLVVWGFVGLVSERRTSRRLEEEVRVRTAELRASEDRYRKTFRAIEDGVVATDAEGRIRLLNSSAEKLTGWSRRQANGRPVEEVLRVHQPADVGATPDDDPPSGQRISLLGEGVEETMGPTRLAVLESRDGRRRHVELTASPIATREHGVTGLVFAFRDVTRRRRIEAELQRTQKLEAVGILAGGIAHDFNNLLQVLMGNLSLVQTSAELDPETAKSLADADTALARARDLTQQLLTFSRGGAPVREAAQIAEVIRDSASFVLRGSKVRCRLDLADDLWVVEIDAGQINQVLHNLLLNAAQAMPGGGEVRITARNVTDVPAPLDGPHVCIEVADEGMGIPEEHLPRIFDPYFSTKEEGRGLGLASAYTVVKKHDGLLTVSSRPGRGTTFRIYLPRAVGDAVTPADHRPQATKRSRFEGLRVLLMDDDRVVRRTALAMLERLGCEVVPAEHGAEALALYDAALDEGRRFDVVLMDLTVPGGMGGQQAMERLHALDPDAVGVVYSGYSTDPVLANHREYGFQGRLSKPFRIEELESVLGEVSGD